MLIRIRSLKSANSDYSNEIRLETNNANFYLICRKVKYKSMKYEGAYFHYKNFLN